MPRMMFLLAILLMQGDASGMFTKIQAEKNIDAKKKLVLTFEKNSPNSNRLPEAYMDLSRALVSRSDFAGATQYAEKAVATLAKLQK